MTRTLESILSRTKSTIIVDNFELPRMRLSGTLDSNHERGTIFQIREINVRLAQLAKSDGRLIINDIQYLQSTIGIRKFAIPQLRFNFYQPYSQSACAAITGSVNAIISADYGRSTSISHRFRRHTLGWNSW